ncbi:hypothetical protein [Erythrobacter sp.]|jgi:hypothetical protein|uniref:hypothetical protein n=1 Tax=Erythrobacter sp. TaxID=1042 RepID=UPI002EBECDA8|nr:hypothetical protein [Erythrobacter sp.]
MKSANIGWIVASVGMALSACGPAPSATENRAEVRWRMTINVDTPEGTRSGSSVWSLTLSEPRVALVSPYNSDFVAEAVAVELPNDQVLFGPIYQNARSIQLLPERHFEGLGFNARLEDRLGNLRSVASNVGATHEIPCQTPEPGDEAWQARFDCLPLVAFRDLDDPTSVFKVDYSNASQSLGDGYAINSIVMTITDEKPSTTIHARLPWLSSLNNSEYQWEKLPDGIFQGAFGMNFSRGLDAP